MFRIDLHGIALSLATYKDFVSVTVTVKSKHDKDFEGSGGLMGSYPKGEQLARDGTIMLDTNKFGQEWQVRSNEKMLFHAIDGSVQHPQQCIMPTQSAKAKKRRRLGESMITTEDATIACQHVPEEDRDACVYDGKFYCTAVTFLFFLNVIFSHKCWLEITLSLLYLEVLVTNDKGMAAAY